MRSHLPELVGVALLWIAGSIAAGEQPAEDCSGRVEAKLMVLRVDELADASDRERIVQAVGAVRGVLHAEGDAEERLLTVLADTQAEGVTAARLVEYLELAGYTAKEVEDTERDAHAGRIWGRSGKVIELPADTVAKTPESSSPATAPADASGEEPAVQVTSLAESLDPLCERFNADVGQPRFVALLSPT